LAGTPLPGRLDVAQALSGVALALFALAHAVFVGSVIVGPGVMDALGAFFEATYLAQIGGPLLFLLLFLHFALAARKMPLRTGELLTFIRHAQAVKHADTRLWLVQAGTALVVLALAPVHMLEVLASLPVEAAKSAEREAGRLAFYSALLVCVGLHMSLGLYRAGVKYGFIGGDGRSLWLRRAWALAALYCGIGLCVMLRFRLMV
jgi:fumarate reductase subunit C